jgi:hypothetical protein
VPIAAPGNSEDTGGRRRSEISDGNARSVGPVSVDGERLSPRRAVCTIAR